MKVFEIIIKPESGFVTPLKGDTLFGHVCWHFASEGILEDLLEKYNRKPFAVVSTPVPKLVGKRTRYCFKRPDLPIFQFQHSPMNHRDRIEILKNRKEVKKKRWMVLEEGKRVRSFPEMEFWNDSVLAKEQSKISEGVAEVREITSFVMEHSQPHNTIHRINDTTGKGQFAPYTVKEHFYYPGTELALFVGIDEDQICLDWFLEALERIGDQGYGRDASTGKGRFTLGETEEVDLLSWGAEKANAAYTLAPSVPETGFFEEGYFSPFTRYGRHGDRLAKAPNPFKNPVVLADEGAVFQWKTDPRPEPWIGRGLTGISKAEPRTVMQGYSLYIPVRLEAKDNE